MRTALEQKLKRIDQECKVLRAENIFQKRSTNHVMNSASAERQRCLD